MTREEGIQRLYGWLIVQGQTPEYAAEVAPRFYASIQSRIDEIYTAAPDAPQTAIGEAFAKFKRGLRIKSLPTDQPIGDGVSLISTLHPENQCDLTEASLFELLKNAGPITRKFWMTRKVVAPVESIIESLAYCACVTIGIGPEGLEKSAIQIIEGLWQSGFTIVPRARDPFAIDERLIPRGMHYEWRKAQVDAADYKIQAPSNVDWFNVPASRHPGLFMPADYEGDIVVGGLTLMEKSKEAIADERLAARLRAEQQGPELLANFARSLPAGFTPIGGAREVRHDPSGITATETAFEGRDLTRRQIKIPRELIPHVQAIFAERDRLFALKNSNSIQVKDEALVEAIENVRKAVTAAAEDQKGVSDGTPATQIEHQPGTGDHATDPEAGAADDPPAAAADD